MTKPVHECEIKRNGAWEAISITEALGLRGERLRCIACHGRVISNLSQSDGTQPHFSHLLGFAYCGQEAGGGSPRHPNALS